MATAIRTRIQLKIGVVTTSGSSLTTTAGKGADLAKVACDAHEIAGGGRLIKEEGLRDHLIAKYGETEYVNGVMAELKGYNNG